MSARKYRQRGYQDEAEPERGGRQKTSGERREGPRGRGLGRPTATLFRCRDCGEKILDPGGVGWDDLCPGCGQALHACVNCAHFDPARRNECRQEIPERIASKTRSNRCELYSPKLVAEIGDGGGPSPDDPRAAFDALFK